MNAVEIARLKALQKLRFRADSSIKQSHPTHQYIATRVDGGFLEREPGATLPKAVKDSLISARDLVDHVDALNAPIFHDLVEKKRAIDILAEEYASRGSMTEGDAISEIESVAAEE